jgi:hypothetical protein
VDAGSIDSRRYDSYLRLLEDALSAERPGTTARSRR